MSESTVLSSIRRLRSLLAAQQGQEQSDEQLLAAFVQRREEIAFATLVRRHGPMVLSVCRRVLGHIQDAEDAYQATFLVLARRAAALRNQSALASFLYGTAFHLASKIRRAAGRRRTYEGQTAIRTPVNPADELMWREVRELLDEEIARLPEKYRSVFVLCCLENLSQAEAGRRLGMKERTVSNRLAEARKRLTQRLRRRGVELTAVLAAMASVQQSASALPAGLIATTIQGALATAAGEGLAGVVSASVAELVERMTTAMMVGKAKIAAALLLSATLVAGAGVWTCRTLAMPQSAVPQTEEPATFSRPTQRQRAETPPKDKGESLSVTGCVLDPNGKPAAGAKVYLDPQTPDEKPMASATTGKDGRFSLLLSRSRLIDPETKFSLRRVRILATAKGYGLDWLDVPLDDAGKEATLRLVEDDVPIQGRILSLEGKPLAGIKVSVRVVEAFPKGGLSRALQAERDGNQIVESTEVRMLWYRHRLPVPLWTATTGADGRFRLDGLGHERILALNVEGPGIHYSEFSVMTRFAEAVRGPHKNEGIRGATFEYFVKPSRLIRGTVREKGTGKPLAGIRIHDMGFTAYVTAEAVTNEQGRYELPGCPKGEKYGVMAIPIQGAPYFGSSIVLADTPGLGPIVADLELVRGIPCEGKVLDGETGQAVPGTISYSPLHPNSNVPDGRSIGRISVVPVSTAAVRADGTFRCVVLPGCGCLAFRAEEPARYQQACVDPRTIEAAGDKAFLFIRNGAGGNGLLLQETYQAIRLINPIKDINKISEILRVETARQVLGAVLDADGKPLADVRVRGLKRREWKTLSSEKFTVHGVNPQRPVPLYFVHETRRLIGSVEVKGTETKPLRVQLQPWAAASGRLVDADGQPLANAKLSGSEFMAEEGRTDAEGRFRLEGLIPGRRYDFWYAKNKPSMSGTVLKGFVAKPGEVRDLGDVRGKANRQEE